MTDMPLESGGFPPTDPSKLTEDAIEKAKAYSDAAVKASQELVVEKINGLAERIIALDRLMLAMDGAQKETVSSALASLKDASDKLAANTAQWQANANEWRGAMTDRERLFLREDAYQRAHTDLIQRVENVNKTLTERVEQAVKSLHDEIGVVRDQVSEFRAVVR